MRLCFSEHVFSNETQSYAFPVTETLEATYLKPSQCTQVVLQQRLGNERYVDDSLEHNFPIAISLSSPLSSAFCLFKFQAKSVNHRMLLLFMLPFVLYLFSASLVAAWHLILFLEAHSWHFQENEQKESSYNGHDCLILQSVHQSTFSFTRHLSPLRFREAGTQCPAVLRFLRFCIISFEEHFT